MDHTVQTADAKTVNTWLENKEILLIDVRETSEFEKEHIPGALLMPLSAFDPELFPIIPGTKLVLHCAIGKRSEAVGKMLLNEGHTAVLNLKGGLHAWKAAGFDTEEPYIAPSPQPKTAAAQNSGFVQ